LHEYAKKKTTSDYSAAAGRHAVTGAATGHDHGQDIESDASVRYQLLKAA
jgi:hypothetical protein